MMVASIGYNNFAEGPAETRQSPEVMQVNWSKFVDIFSTVVYYQVMTQNVQSFSFLQREMCFMLH
jgi:hypothetical protein